MADYSHLIGPAMRQMPMPVAVSSRSSIPVSGPSNFWDMLRSSGRPLIGMAKASHQKCAGSFVRTVSFGCLATLLGAFISPGAYAQSSTIETIVLVRHGEKPEKGLGQLSCKGLNRSLALPHVLSGLFGKPDFVFAPNPSKQKLDSGVLYDYVRPLATIEPTAIAAGLPVKTGFGYKQIKLLEKELAKPRYRSALVFVAWEHSQIISIARDIMSGSGADPSLVPKWQGDDFDGIYILRLTRIGKTATASFERKTEGLDSSVDACPQ